MTNILAIIPARGGSKSIPRKNIKLMAGVPLIAYSIAAAKAARQIARVIVTTDDDEIAAVARRWGAEVPFMRPAELAQDETPDLPVFTHALNWLAQNEDYRPDTIVHLRPTTPFRRLSHVEHALDILTQSPEVDSVRSVSVPSQNPYKMWVVGTEGQLRPLIEGPVPEAYNLPRQRLPIVYLHNGYVDVIRRQTLLEQNSMTGAHIAPLILNPEDLIDIDSPTDWRLAEYLLVSGSVTMNDLGFTLTVS